MEDLNYDSESAEHERKEGQQKPDPKESAGYWLRWVKAAKKSAEPHWDQAKEAWSEYEKCQSKSNREHEKKVYPIYWSSCQTIEPAYFGRVPKPIGKRRFDINDPVATTASIAVERLGEALIERGHFYDAITAGVQDFINADKAAVQVIYDEEIELVEEQTQLLLSETSELLLPDGTPYEGEVTEQADEMGMPLYFGMQQVEKKKKCIRLSQLSYDEVLHTPDAKSEAEIKEKAYFFSLPKDDAIAQFGLDPKGAFPWKSKKSDAKESDIETADCEYLEGWEIHCKTTKKIYYIAEGYPEFLRPPKEDEFKLTGFFPSTKFIIGSKPLKSMYPSPAWTQLRPTSQQLNLMYNRVFELIQSIRRRALIDGNTPELVQAFNDLDNAEWIQVKNLTSIVEKGGLSNLIQYLPVAELVTAISELNSLTDLFKTNFYEWFGIPDIMRAASDPVESLGAQELKQGNANSRFKKSRRQVDEMVREALEMMVDLALKVYDENEIAEIVGVEYMQPEHQQNFAAAIALLKNDDARMVRIDIETDSTNFVDEEWQQQQRNTVANTVITGLQTIGQISKNDPQFTPIALRTLLTTLSGIRMGKEFEDGIKEAVGGLMEQVNNPAPPPPPPPDYEGMKIENERAKIDLQAKDLEFKYAQLQLEREKMQADLTVKQVEAQVKAMKVDYERELETVWQQLESMKMALQEKERMAEERRLAFETQISALQNIQSAAQPVMINMGKDETKSRTKLVTPIRDAEGNLISARIEEVVQ